MLRFSHVKFIDLIVNLHKIYIDLKKYSSSLTFKVCIIHHFVCVSEAS